MAVARAECGYMCCFDPQPTLYKSHASGESRLWPSCICRWPYLCPTNRQSSPSPRMDFRSRGVCIFLLVKALSRKSRTEGAGGKDSKLDWFTAEWKLA